MRQSLGALALIRKEAEEGTLWLARWNRHWRAYSFVGGHKRPDETFRECVIREVGEELGLREESDRTVAPQPLAHLDYTAWSESAQAETAYTMELFDVELTSDTARRAVDADSACRWLTEAEVRARRCADGQPVSRTMGELLTRAGAVRQSTG
ncbi:MAG: NUDIX hydrolase [Planctomycetes bacterium]|nr:NUDIX hydrolase [Planctomycetota bacterium]